MSYNCTAWVYDGATWSAYTPYKNIFGYSNSVPQTFIVDRDGYVRFGRLGGIGTTESIITDCVNELL